MDKQFKEVIDKLIQAETDGLRNLALIDVEYPRQLAHYVATAFFDVYHDKQKLSAERAKVIEHVTVAV
ncbi:hypothetical protein LWT71_22965, partial [Enterobacter hormaechei]|nr:hypothetical protein [Enterobacter hormaechei]